MSNKSIQLEKELKIIKDQLAEKTIEYEKLLKKYWIIRGWWIDHDEAKYGTYKFKNVK